MSAGRTGEQWDEHWRIQQVMEENSDIIRTWKPEYEMYPLQYSHVGLAGFAALTAFKLNGTFRQILNLGTYRRLYTALPTIAMGVATTMYYHKGVISDPIVCNIVKSKNSSFNWMSGILQGLTGAGYPLITAGLFTARCARIRNLERLMTLTKGTNTFTYLGSVLPKKIIMILFCVNVAAGFIASLLQISTFDKVREFKDIRDKLEVDSEKTSNIVPS